MFSPSQISTVKYTTSKNWEQPLDWPKCSFTTGSGKLETPNVASRNEIPETPASNITCFTGFSIEGFIHLWNCDVFWYGGHEHILVANSVPNLVLQLCIPRFLGVFFIPASVFWSICCQPCVNCQRGHTLNLASSCQKWKQGLFDEGKRATSYHWRINPLERSRSSLAPLPQLPFLWFWET